MTGSLEGKTAIIAGAGGAVGRAIARRFAEAGACLMLADTDDAALKQTAAEVAAANGVENGNGQGGREKRFACFAHAIEDKLGVTNLIAATVDHFGRVDVLVTNPGLCAPGGLLDLSARDFDTTLNRHIRGVFLQTKLVTKRMLQQREADPGFTGALVNISSIAGQRTVSNLLAYSVASAALDQLTRSAAASLAPYGIRVNALALGSVMTTSLRDALNDDEDLRVTVEAATPMGRIGEAGEAAEAALFLASPASGFITGQILAVDGGRMVLDPLTSPAR